MDRLVFEVKPLPPILCSYPTCTNSRGGSGVARWLIRQEGSGKDFLPICFRCKAEIKRKLGADETRGSDDGTATDRDPAVPSA